MTERSFITPRQRDFIARQMRRAQATKLVLQDGGMALVLSRWNAGLQKWDTIPAQQVTIKFDNTQIGGTSGDAAAVKSVTGTLTKETPFNVEQGDLFSYGPPGDEQQGTIDLVQPVKLGRQSAKFSLVVGEQ